MRLSGFGLIAEDRATMVRFHGKYPVRKSIQTGFFQAGGEHGLLFPPDAVICCADA